MRRPTPSRSSRPGVFRVPSWIPWLRRRPLPPGYLQVAVQGGSADAGAGGAATAAKVAPALGASGTAASGRATGRKVVALGGTCAAGASSTGVAARVAQQAGSATAGAGVTALHRKAATPLAVAAAGASSRGSVIKRATPQGVVSAAPSGKAIRQPGSVVAAGAGTRTAAAVVKRVALYGSCVAAAGGRVTSVKRAVGAGACTAGSSTTGVGAKRTAQAGSAAAVAASAATARKLTVQTGRSAAGASGHVEVRKTAHGTGAAIAVTSPTAVARKLTTQTGRGAAGPGGIAAQVKRTAGAGRVSAGASGAVVNQKRAPVRGVGSAGMAPMSRTSAAFLGAACGGASSTSAQRKIAKITGRCTAIGAGRGAASRRIGQRGICTAGPGGRVQAVKRAPQAGRVVGGALTYGFIIIVGPTTGFRVSEPLLIPDGPIAGSRIVWDAQLNGGGVLVETSVDGGASWQEATNGAAIPRLRQGDVRSARTVLTRVTLTRETPDSPSPRLFRMEVEVAVDSSQEELCPVGVFTLNDVEITDGPGGVAIEVAGADLSRKISRNRWDDTYIIEAGTNYATAIQDMVRNRMPDAVFNFASTSRTTPRLFFGEQSSNDPWQDAQDLATAIGYELFFDARGICTLRPEPDPEIGDSVWEFEDRARPTMIELRRRVTDENTYNKVVVTGEGTSNTAPVRAVAIDDDPSSPTYYLGPYGTVTMRFTSSSVTTGEQAQDAADALLRRVKGATEAVELSVVPMPALEPGDVVTVTRDKTKIEGRFLIDQLRIPLGADESMRAVGRRQRQ